MNEHATRTLTLFDLLARSWQTEAEVVDVRFSGDGTAAFATAGGALLIAPPDSEPPDTRIRVTGDLGQTTIRPRSRDAAPLTVVTGLSDRVPAIAATRTGFLAGDADGRVLAIDADGAAEPVLTLDGAVVAIDHRSGATAAADASSLAVVRSTGTTRRPVPGLRALALSPAGDRLAAANAAQVVILGDEGDETVNLRHAARLAWRDDASWLGVALGGDGLALVDTSAGAQSEPVNVRNFPAAVRTLAWSAAADAVVASGAFRIAAWDAGALPSTERALLTGQPGLVVVEAVAAHPARPIVAAGYANGQVVIAQVGGRDELMLRPGGAAVTCLAFSPDGRHLAIGDAGGTAAIASFPQSMFK